MNLYVCEYTPKNNSVKLAIAGTRKALQQWQQPLKAKKFYQKQIAETSFNSGN